MAETRRSFDPEFRGGAVRIVRETGKSIAQVARDLHEWMFGTRFWDAGGTAGVDDAFAERHSHGIGAEIMGANKFGPPG
jgi:hypothetical protein